MTKVLDSQDWARFLERVRQEHGSSWWTAHQVMMTTPWKDVTFGVQQLHIHLGTSVKKDLWKRGLCVQKKSGGYWRVLNRKEVFYGVPTTESEFLDRCLRYSPGSSVLSTDVYQLYQQWAVRMRRRMTSRETFWMQARTAGIFGDDVRKVRRRRSEGLVAKPDAELGAAQYVITNVAYSPEYLSRLRGVPLPA